MKNKGMKIFVRALFKVLSKIIFNVKVIGEKHIPMEGPYILCSNHRTMADVPLIAGLTKGKRWIYFMAKKEFFSIPFVGWFFRKMSAFPVDRGKADIVSIRTAVRYLQNNKVVGIFPQGTRDTNEDELPGRKGPALLAAMTEAPILPVLIEGTFKFRKTIKIYVGKPFDLGMKKKVKYAKEEYYNKSQEIMKKIYSLSEV